MPNYHFYLLDEDELIIDILDAQLPDDLAAGDHALLLLSRCRAVEVLRGPEVLGKFHTAQVRSAS